jgi:hypothetical protein
MDELYKGPKKIKRQIVVPIKITWECAECYGGDMRANGRSTTRGIGPTHYEHICIGCGHTLWIAGECYPAMEYEAADE